MNEVAKGKHDQQIRDGGNPDEGKGVLAGFDDSCLRRLHLFLFLNNELLDPTIEFFHCLDETGRGTTDIGLGEQFAVLGNRKGAQFDRGPIEILEGLLNLTDDLIGCTLGFTEELDAVAELLQHIFDELKEDGLLVGKEIHGHDDVPAFPGYLHSLPP